MKKVLVMAIAALLMTGMASCGGNSSSTENTEETTPDYGQQIKDNKTLGREFMEQNAKNDSVVQTKSGLQYMVLKEGTGAWSAVSPQPSPSTKSSPAGPKVSSS